MDPYGSGSQSTLQKVVKFEYNHNGEDYSPIYIDLFISYIEEKERCDSVVYLSFEVVLVDHFKERAPVI